MDRIPRYSLMMEIARLIAQRATCERLRVGAVAVDGHTWRILATGYNGAPAGFPHCSEEGCLIEGGHCIRCVHAEMNVMAQSALHGVSLDGAVLFVTAFPCARCAPALFNAGIAAIVYDKNYGTPENFDAVMRLCKIPPRYFLVMSLEEACEFFRT